MELRDPFENQEIVYKEFHTVHYKEESKYYGDFEMMYALKRILAKFVS